MKIKVIIKQILILIIAVVCLSKNSSANSGAKVLTTDNFTINYNISNSICAVALAARLESYHDKISSFLEYNSPFRINVFVSEKNNKLQLLDLNNNIFVPTGGNFNIIEKELFSKIFMIYLHEIMRDGRGTSAIDETFINAIIQYSDTEYKYIDLLRNDLLDIKQMTSIDLENIDRLNKDEQKEVYTVLIDFIISNYGKKNLIRILKDTDYYNGFYKSLSKITGENINLISENFNVFLHKQKSDSSAKTSNKKQLLHEIDEFTDISYSVSVNDIAAVLQQNKNDFRLLLKSRQNCSTIKLVHNEGGSFFADVVFLNNDTLALVENVKSGSIIHIYDIKNFKFINEISIPYLFISDINPLNDSSLIFSAMCGFRSDIYTFKINTGELGMLTESGDNYCPVVVNNKIYFISNTNKNSIVEMDTISGKLKTIFSSEQAISHLNCVNEKMLVFSKKMNGLDDIFTFDLQAGNLRQITRNNNSNLAPQISGNYFYFFSFYKYKYQLFLDVYNPAEY